ncbi:MULTISPECIES: histidine utilization repressor [Nitrincola]|uniref:Histidine utilization repressor n=1 Tax=Nitrincola nitratireducens TaxID=1229521 RepID=W9VL32_9GAMM|nr:MULTISPECIES: histidine utilization repressor [Nitrincola]EXJ11245.1 hypothetical protein D791_01700 [Nitrincola nitratireducens]
MDRQPRYQQIRQYISDAIRAKQFVSGDRIPTEAALQAQFSVSRMTVNKALRDLVQEGLLVRYPGLGTFVSDAKAESPLTDIRNIAEEVQLRGHVYSCDVIKLEAVLASEWVAMRLGVMAGSRVYHSLILHKENSVPIQLEDRYVSADLVPHYLAQDFLAQTPNQYLSATCPATDIEHIVEAVLPDEKVRAYLQVDATMPCLQVSRRTWSGERLISFALLTHPGSSYKLRSVVRLGKD